MDGGLSGRVSAWPAGLKLGLLRFVAKSLNLIDRFGHGECLRLPL